MGELQTGGDEDARGEKVMEAKSTGAIPAQKKPTKTERNKATKAKERAKTAADAAA